MNKRDLSGIIIALVGAVFLFLPSYVLKEIRGFSLVFGFALIALGIGIFLNKKEDTIEEVEYG